MYRDFLLDGNILCSSFDAFPPPTQTKENPKRLYLALQGNLSWNHQHPPKVAAIPWSKPSSVDAAPYGLSVTEVPVRAQNRLLSIDSTLLLRGFADGKRSGVWGRLVTLLLGRLLWCHFVGDKVEGMRAGMGWELDWIGLDRFGWNCIG